MNVLLMGAPGSGKSTVGQRLAGDLGWKWISSGEILRESTEPWVVEKLKTAELFDDEMILSLVVPRAQEAPNAILDGFPRTLKQAQGLVERGVKIEAMIELTISLEEVEKRLNLRGRAQDTVEIVEQRFKMYERTKAEIMASLVAARTKVFSIDAVGSPDEVYARTEAVVREMMK